MLGVGILGLPVKLARSGFSPLLVTYTFGFFMQVAVYKLYAANIKSLGFGAVVCYGGFTAS